MFKWIYFVQTSPPPFFLPCPLYSIAVTSLAGQYLWATCPAHRYSLMLPAAHIFTAESSSHLQSSGAAEPSQDVPSGKLLFSLLWNTGQLPPELSSMHRRTNSGGGWSTGLHLALWLQCCPLPSDWRTLDHHGQRDEVPLWHNWSFLWAYVV